MLLGLKPVRLRKILLTRDLLSRHLRSNSAKVSAWPTGIEFCRHPALIWPNRITDATES